uniref:Amine oxidase domain-containing protein n=1 Tax=Rhizochromulina marina TaxID=1034831 RepID=A0A7S2SMK6_9STRA|mmetsp:Transcript_32618/g.94441  ORF Transcript_32618/g.94441 Transcript_32618/m.94441 type:complete len:1041 (+) Transcript_32618:2-3124(+)
MDMPGGSPGVAMAADPAAMGSPPRQPAAQGLAGLAGLAGGKAWAPQVIEARPGPRGGSWSPEGSAAAASGGGTSTGSPLIKVKVVDWVQASLGPRTAEQEVSSEGGSPSGPAAGSDSPVSLGKGIRVIILGAGAAGLSAAATLERALPGADVRIFEARNRIGGRIHSARLPRDIKTHRDGKAPGVVALEDSCSVDLGASYVHGCNITNPVWRLAKVTERLLDTTKGGYSEGWGHTCIWRSLDGTILPSDSVRRVFSLAWKLKAQVEDPEVEHCPEFAQICGIKRPRPGCVSLASPPPKEARGSDGGREDVPLRPVVDACATKLLTRLKRPLTALEQRVLKCTEVLLWSYVAPMNELSTRAIWATHKEEDETHREDSAGRATPPPTPGVVGAAQDSQASSSENAHRGRKRSAPKPFDPGQSEDPQRQRGSGGRGRRTIDDDADLDKLSWNDGLVVDGYHDLVVKQLAPGNHIETNRVVRQVEWQSTDRFGRPVCRVTSMARRRDRNDPSPRHTTPASGFAEHVPEGAGLEEDGLNTGSEDNPDGDLRVDECDFVVVALPLGVMKGLHPDSAVAWTPALPPRKREAISRIGFGAENKVILRFPEIFWDQEAPYIQTVDERFRVLNGHYFHKPNTLVVHCSPPFGNGYNGLSDAQVIDQVLGTLRGMYGAHRVPMPVFSHVTRWHEDPFSMGAYSYWKAGMSFDHVQDYARPEPDPELHSSTRIQDPTSEHFGGLDLEDSGAGDAAGADWAIPRLFFCGEHATIRDAQCVHGACVSGERAGRQVAAAALGQLTDLAVSCRMGEEFWFVGEEEEPPAQDKRPQADGHSPARVQPDVLRNPSFSPFPTMECVEWFGRRWNFRCPCGKSGENYDDGTEMIECSRCKVWQHVVCVRLCKGVPRSLGGHAGSAALGKRTWGPETDDGDDPVHLCRSCAPSSYQHANPLEARRYLERLAHAISQPRLLDTERKVETVQVSSEDDEGGRVEAFWSLDGPHELPNLVPFASSAKSEDEEAEEVVDKEREWSFTNEDLDEASPAGPFSSVPL